MNDDAIASTGAEEARRPRREADLKLLERLHAADVAKTLRYPTGLGYLKLRQDYPEGAGARCAFPGRGGGQEPFAVVISGGEGRSGPRSRETRQSGSCVNSMERR